MKQLKTISFFLFLLTFITSCTNDTSFIEEQSSLDRDSSKGLLNARTAIDADSFGHQLDATSGATITGYSFSPSSYDLEYNDFYFDLYEYFEYNDYIQIKAMDYNTLDELVYFIGDEDYSRRYLYSLDKETEEVSEIGLLSGNNEPSKSSIKLRDDDENLGNAHDLAFDANGTLYIAFKSGKIMTYDLDTNRMEEFVDLDDYEFYVGANAVGFTYDFDNDRLLYGSTDYNNYEDGYPASLLGIDCSSDEVSDLFSFSRPDLNYYSTNVTNMEYIGNNKLVYSDKWNSSEFTAVDIVSEEYDFIGDDYFGYYKDLMYTYNPDVDGDGVLNEDDAHPNSNMSEEISFDGCYPGVANAVLSNGSTMADEVDDLVAEIWAKINSGDMSRYYDAQKDFQREMTYVLAKWYRTERVITDREKTKIVRCVRSSRIFEDRNL